MICPTARAHRLQSPLTGASLVDNRVLTNKPLLAKWGLATAIRANGQNCPVCYFHLLHHAEWPRSLFSTGYKLSVALCVPQAPGEKCELSTGQPHTVPHRDRPLMTVD
jgi:hypothetical protein